MGPKRILSLVLVALGLSAVVLVAGCKSAPERAGMSASQEALAVQGEEPEPPEVEGECPALRAAIEPKACEGLPPYHGLSPNHPGEWGADPTYVKRLVCADGSSGYLIPDPSPGRRQLAAGEEEAEARVHRWTAVCDSKIQSIYVREESCGNPCPPQGFRLMPSEAYDVLLSTSDLPARKDPEAMIAALEKVKALAPDVERTYTWGFNRLKELELHEEAAQFVEEGLKRIASSETLLRGQSEARANLGGGPSAGSNDAKNVRYSRDPSDTTEDGCEDLPDDFGLSPLFPLELPSFVPMAQLFCEDGSAPKHRRDGSLGKFKGTTTSPAGGMGLGREPADIIDSYTVQCPSQGFTVYLNKYRSGRPCAPRGMHFLPEEAFSALVRAGKYVREDDLAAAIEEARRARHAAPGVERVHLELLSLMIRGHDIPEALEVAGEGVRQVPASSSLRLNLAGLLMKFERVEEAEKEIDDLLAGLNEGGDQRFRATALCAKASISHSLEKAEEAERFRKEACGWGSDSCCAGGQAAQGSAAR